jgi:hypothetical protein
MITVAALFTKNNGQPATGLTLAQINLYLYRRRKSDGVVSTVWTAQNPTEEIGGGLYSRAYTGEDVNTYEYFAYGQYTGATVLDTNYATQNSAWFSEAAVWGYTTRTLTSSAAATGATVSGSSITITRGDTMSAALTGLGSVAAYVTLDFTVKGDVMNSDNEAVIHIRKNASGVGDGLLRLNGAAAADASKGSITINDAALGNITIAMDATVTDDLDPYEGMFNVDADVTMAVV